MSKTHIINKSFIRIFIFAHKYIFYHVNKYFIICFKLFYDNLQDWFIPQRPTRLCLEDLNDAYRYPNAISVHSFDPGMYDEPEHAKHTDNILFHRWGIGEVDSDALYQE